METITQELKQYITHLFYNYLTMKHGTVKHWRKQQKIFYPNVLLMIPHLHILHLKLIPTTMMNYMS